MVRATHETAAWSGPWLDALPRPVIALDPRGRISRTNTEAERLFGADPESLTGRLLAEVAFAETDRGGFGQVVEMVAAGGDWHGIVQVVAPGRTHRMHLRVAPVRDGDEVVGAVLTMDAAGPEGAGAAEVSERLTRLARVAGELQAANTMGGLTNVVVSHMAEAAGATTASLSVLVDDHTLALMGLTRGTTEASLRWATFPVDTDTPAGTAVVTRQTLLMSGRSAITDRFPDLPLAAPGERSMLCLPLVVGEQPVGVATLSFPGKVELDGTELDFFSVMADTCAQALERIRVQERVDEQHAKLSFLVEASEELASSLDYESTLKQVAWLAVPDLADWCAISLEQDGVLRTLAVAHSDPEKVALAKQFQERFPQDPDSGGGAYEVLRTGESQLVPEVTEEMLAEAVTSEEQLEMVRALNLYSALTVALKARGRVFGVITWINGEDGRRFGPDDVAFGEDLARRAAVAIDNALLHSELRQVADRLQEAVLPPALPVIDGWQLGASYSSAGRVSVGGDFYDAIQVGDGRLAMVIGDVMGRGVTAAAAMSQVRAAVRAFAAVNPDPQTMLERLDTFYDRFPSEQLVTLLYALADPARDQVVLSCAGHPAPVVIDSNGAAHSVGAARGRLLGVGRAKRSVITVPLLPGETLLMFTDGLIERRDEDPQESEQRLVNVCEALQPEASSAGLDQLVAEMRDPTRDDDVAVLAARRVGS